MNDIFAMGCNGAIDIHTPEFVEALEAADLSTCPTYVLIALGERSNRDGELSYRIHTHLLEYCRQAPRSRWLDNINNAGECFARLALSGRRHVDDGVQLVQELYEHLEKLALGRTAIYMYCKRLTFNALQPWHEPISAWLLQRIRLATLVDGYSLSVCGLAALASEDDAQGEFLADLEQVANENRALDGFDELSAFFFDRVATSLPHRPEWLRLFSQLAATQIGLSVTKYWGSEQRGHLEWTLVACGAPELATSIRQSDNFSPPLVPLGFIWDRHAPLERRRPFFEYWRACGACMTQHFVCHSTHIFQPKLIERTMADFGFNFAETALQALTSLSWTDSSHVAFAKNLASNLPAQMPNLEQDLPQTTKARLLSWISANPQLHDPQFDILRQRLEHGAVPPLRAGIDLATAGVNYLQSVGWDAAGVDEVCRQIRARRFTAAGLLTQSGINLGGIPIEHILLVIGQQALWQLTERLVTGCAEGVAPDVRAVIILAALRNGCNCHPNVWSLAGEMPVYEWLDELLTLEPLLYGSRKATYLADVYRWIRPAQGRYLVGLRVADKLVARLVGAIRRSLPLADSRRRHDELARLGILLSTSSALFRMSSESPIHGSSTAVPTVQDLGQWLEFMPDDLSNLYEHKIALVVGAAMLVQQLRIEAARRAASDVFYHTDDYQQLSDHIALVDEKAARLRSTIKERLPIEVMEGADADQIRSAIGNLPWYWRCYSLLRNIPYRVGFLEALEYELMEAKAGWNVARAGLLERLASRSPSSDGPGLALPGAEEPPSVWADDALGAAIEAHLLRAVESLTPTEHLHLSVRTDVWQRQWHRNAEVQEITVLATHWQMLEYQRGLLLRLDKAMDHHLFGELLAPEAAAGLTHEFAAIGLQGEVPLSLRDSWSPLAKWLEAASASVGAEDLTSVQDAAHSLARTGYANAVQFFLGTDGRLHAMVLSPDIGMGERLRTHWEDSAKPYQRDGAVAMVTFANNPNVDLWAASIMATKANERQDLSNAYDQLAREPWLLEVKAFLELLRHSAVVFCPELAILPWESVLAPGTIARYAALSHFCRQGGEDAPPRSIEFGASFAGNILTSEAECEVIRDVAKGKLRQMAPITLAQKIMHPIAAVRQAAGSLLGGRGSSARFTQRRPRPDQIMSRVDLATRMGRNSWNHLLMHGNATGRNEQNAATAAEAILRGPHLELRSQEQLPAWFFASLRLRGGVFLSSCEAGLMLPRQFHGDAEVPAAISWFGVAAAFATAGAELVIAPLWSVDSLANFLFVRAFYAHAIAHPGDGVQQALEAARESLRNMTHADVARWTKAHTEKPLSPADASRSKPFEAPFYWAGYMALGDIGRPLGSFIPAPSFAPENDYFA